MLPAPVSSTPQLQLLYFSWFLPAYSASSEFWLPMKERGRKKRDTKERKMAEQTFQFFLRTVSACCHSKTTYTLQTEVLGSNENSRTI